MGKRCAQRASPAPRPKKRTRRHSWLTIGARHDARRAAVAPVDGSLDDYVRDVLHLRACRLPTFVRIRYDVNVESLSTGHYYGIFYDRCHLTEHPADAICQCEIEYCRTRTTRQPDEADVLAGMELVSAWVETVLADHDMHTIRSHYSKLSFLRDVVARHNA